MTAWDDALAFIANAPGQFYEQTPELGVQCRALILYYAEAIYPGVSWVESTGYGNACDMYANANPLYWDKIPNVPGDDSVLPRQGDVVVVDIFRNAQGYGSDYGHIFICSADADAVGIPSIEQNGYDQARGCYAVYNTWAEYSQADGSSAVIGWLRPKCFANTAAPSAPALDGNQRVVATPVNYRKAASTSADILQTFDAGDVCRFKGYVHGEPVAGSDVWFQGYYTDGFSHSSGFTDTGTHDLPDLTPTPIHADPTQRTTGDSGGNARTAPSTSASVIQVVAAGTTITVDGYTDQGETVAGSSVWLHTATSGLWMHSSCFTNGDPAGLSTVPLPAAAPAAAAVAPATPAVSTRPDGAKLWAIDVSTVQDPAVMAAAKNAGVNGVIIRAGNQGPSHGGGPHCADAKLDQMLAAAKAADLPILAVYWESYGALDPAEDAADAWAVIQPLGLPVIPLVEDIGGTTAGDFLTKWCAAYPGTVLSIIYGNNSTLPGGTYATGKRIWHAGYSAAPGSLPDLHQYDNHGRLPGYTGDVDLSCSMSMDAAAMFAAPLPTLVPAPKPEPAPGADSSEPEPTGSTVVVPAPTKETPVTSKPQPTAPVIVPQVGSNPVALLPARGRAIVYAIFSVIGVALGAVAVGFSAAGAGHPVWLTVCEAVYSFLGGAFGYTALSHTTDSAPPTE